MDQAQTLRQMSEDWNDQLSAGDVAISQECAQSVLPFLFLGAEGLESSLGVISTSDLRQMIDECESVISGERAGKSNLNFSNSLGFIQFRQDSGRDQQIPEVEIVVGPNERRATSKTILTVDKDGTLKQPLEADTEYGIVVKGMTSGAEAYRLFQKLNSEVQISLGMNLIYLGHCPDWEDFYRKRVRDQLLIKLNEVDISSRYGMLLYKRLLDWIRT